MKRFLSILLALMLCMSCVAYAEPTANISPENVFIVGTPEMNGEFIDGFGGSSYDDSIRTMVHGYYATIELTSAGEYVTNPVAVEDVAIEADDSGNKWYTYKLCEDLKWSNGSAITAKDYVGALLWKASPTWFDLGATSTVGLGLLG